MFFRIRIHSNVIEIDLSHPALSVLELSSAIFSRGAAPGYHMSRLWRLELQQRVPTLQQRFAIAIDFHRSFLWTHSRNLQSKSALMWPKISTGIP
jgi:hypothetical protein